jgi:hypothetical protein
VRLRRLSSIHWENQQCPLMGALPASGGAGGALREGHAPTLGRRARGIHGKGGSLRQQGDPCRVFCALLVDGGDMGAESCREAIAERERGANY